MTRIKLKYVQEIYDPRSGGIYRYFRRPGLPRVKLPGLPGSDEFMEAYRAALAGMPIEIGASRSGAGSVSAAIAPYYNSTEFKDALAPSTQAMRRAILERFCEQHGDKPIGLLPTKFIVLTLGTMKPHAQRNWLKAIRGLMQFALSREMIAHDPTQGIKQAKVKGDGFYAWEEADIAKYRAFYHQLDSKPRLAIELLLNTVQRRGDVIRLGRQHLRDGVDAAGLPIKTLHFRQQKTGALLDIPVLPELKAVLDLVPADQLTFLVTRSGKPYSGNDFSEQFRVWCDEAGLPAACSAHGLRKAGAIRLALAGCSTKEIAAWGGWKSLHEVERYTLAAEQRQLTRNAAARLLRGNEAATPTVKTLDPFYKKGV